jgi:hypothetical protein
MLNLTSWLTVSISFLRVCFGFLGSFLNLEVGFPENHSQSSSHTHFITYELEEKLFNMKQM